MITGNNMYYASAQDYLDSDLQRKTRQVPTSLPSGETEGTVVDAEGTVVDAGGTVGQVPTDDPALDAKNATPIGMSGSIEDIMKDPINQNKSYAQIFKEYNDNAKEQGRDPMDVLSMFTYLQNKDAGKTPRQVEEEDRRLKNKQKWDQIGQLLGNIGNFIGVANGGQSIQMPNPAELTARQKMQVDEARKLREARNSQYINLYNQDRVQQMQERKQKADAENKAAALLIKQNESEARMNRWKAEVVKLQKTNANSDAIAQAKIKLLEAQTDYNQSKADRENLIIQYLPEKIKSEINRNNRSNLPYDTEVVEDENLATGIKTRTTTKTPSGTQNRETKTKQPAKRQTKTQL